MQDSPTNPLNEVFGFPTSNFSDKSKRFRAKKLCPYNNKVPNCTKDKAQSPLGVCSILHQNQPIITCPIRFRQDWKIIEDSASFAFSSDVAWTSLSEVKIKDKYGVSAGNIDFVLVAYNPHNQELTDFCSVEVQGVYVSGNIRQPFENYLSAPNANFSWKKNYNFPRPDFLSSSRKRLIPQIMYKGGIFNHWGKKQVIILQKPFFDTLAKFEQAPRAEDDMAWFIYDLQFNETNNSFDIVLVETVYSKFESTLQAVSKPSSGDIKDFMDILQEKLDSELKYPPDAPSLTDII